MSALGVGCWDRKWEGGRREEGGGSLAAWLPGHHPARSLRSIFGFPADHLGTALHLCNSVDIDIDLSLLHIELC